MNYTEKEFVRSVMPQRPDDANKGTMGTLLSICGSYGMAGAAMLVYGGLRDIAGCLT